MPLNDLYWTEDMTPAESAMMLRRGPADLAAMRQAARIAPLMSAQLGPKPPPTLYPNDPGIQTTAATLDYLLKLSGLFGTPLTAAGSRAAVPLTSGLSRLSGAAP